MLEAVAAALQLNEAAIRALGRALYADMFDGVDASGLGLDGRFPNHARFLHRFCDEGGTALGLRDLLTVQTARVLRHTAGSKSTGYYDG